MDRDRPFIDHVVIEAQAGDGGDGCTSFQRQAHEPRGGPDGGDGGHGGNVIIRANEGVSTLSDLNFKDKIEADSGQAGGPSEQRGACGEDCVVRVPPGTMIYDDNTGEKIGELTHDGSSLTVACGGSGGRGNRCFKNSQRQTPRFHELGETGEYINLRLELKLIADIGILGRPNAGKSTLLRSLTGAKPEVASHEFTTKSPNLGVLFNDYQERMTLCDIPGLINNAHKGAGLGLEFLRHIDRTSILIHMIDLSASDPPTEYEMIRGELRQHDESLLERPTVIVGNKRDLVDEDLVELVKHEIKPLPGPFIEISALEQTGLDQLTNTLWEMFDRQDMAVEDDGSDDVDRVIQVEQDTPMDVLPLDDRYLVRGDEVEELVKRFQLKNPDALSYVRDRLLSSGLHHKLEQAGCEPGDDVQVGRQVFEYTG